MRAAVLHGRHDLRIEEIAVPRPAAGEVALRVRAVGLCGTDAAEYGRGPSMMPVHDEHPVSGHRGPMVIGHEFGGEVVEVGSGVDPAWIGRLVASCGAIPCGTCWQCARGRTNLCENYAAVGLHRDGAAAEFVVAPLTSCEPVDTLGLSPDAAALCQPMSVAVHAARRSRVVPGERALLLGAGGIGAFVTFVLAHNGVRTLVVDPDAQRLETAQDLGAHVVAEPTPQLDVRELLDGPPDVVLEASGSPHALTTAWEALPGGGRLVLVGMQEQPRAVDLRRSTLREHEIIGTNAMVRDPDFSQAVHLVAARSQGWADVAPTALPLDGIVSGALEPVARGTLRAIKVLVDPTAAAPRRSETVRRQDAR